MKSSLKRLGTMLLAMVLMLSVMAPLAAGAATVGSSLIDMTEKGSITLYKYERPETDTDPAIGDGSDAPKGLAPLSGIEFKAYLVTSNIAAMQSYDTSAAFDYANSTAAATATTNSDGYAKLNELAVGLYYIVESANPAVTNPSNFYVSIPMTDPTDNDSWIYDVTVYPKNSLAPGPQIDKDITEVGNDDDTFDIGDIIHWILLPEVPADMANSKSYVVTDTFASYFTLASDSVVKVTAGADEYGAGGTVLTVGDDYTVAVDGQKLTVSLTADGRAKVAAAYEDYFAEEYTSLPTLQIWVDTELNKEALGFLGTDLYNNAELDYTNSAGYVYETTDVPEIDRPEAHTGGVVLKKTNSSGEELEGVTFKIYATLANAVAGTNALSAYDAPDATQSVSEFASGADGLVYIYGLEFGVMGEDSAAGYTTYYVVETSTLDGYELLGEPFEVVIDQYSHIVDAENDPEYTIINYSSLVLPITGGAGVALYIGGGLLLLAVAAVLIVTTRKGKKNKA